MIHEFRLDVAADWPERVLAFAATFPARTQAIPARAVRAGLPDFDRAYRAAVPAIAALFGEPVRTRDDRDFGSLNVNLFHGAGAVCDWHRDDNAYTVLAYPHALADGDGGELLIRDAQAPGGIRAIRPTRGLVIAFMGSAIEHAVAPLQGAASRVSVLMAFQSFRIPDPPAADYLHVRG